MWSTQPLLVKPPSRIAAVMLAALSLTKQLIFFCQFPMFPRLTISYLNGFVLCAFHIWEMYISRTANLRLSLSSMKCAEMLRYESIAQDVQQSVVSAKNMVEFIQVFAFSLASSYIFGMIFFRKVFATG